MTFGGVEGVKEKAEPAISRLLSFMHYAFNLSHFPLMEVFSLFFSFSLSLSLSLSLLSTNFYYFNLTSFLHLPYNYDYNFRNYFSLITSQKPQKMFVLPQDNILIPFKPILFSKFPAKGYFILISLWINIIPFNMLLS